MSSLGRPNAEGTYDINSKTGQIIFPDDKTYSFIFDTSSGGIRFSFGGLWYKKLVDVTAISGQYKCGLINVINTCFIIQKGNSLSIDISLVGNRPNAYGTYNANTRSGEITFEDDATYSFIFDINKGKIIWNNDPSSEWYKKLVDVTVISGQYKCGSITYTCWIIQKVIVYLLI
eukprot:334866_1